MSEETNEFIGVILLVIIAITTGVSLTHLGTDWSWRRQIAGHHAAEFYIDQDNYRQWRWLDCNPKPPPVSVPNDSTTVNP